MRRIASIFLLLLFLVTNSGMAMTLHYCGKKVSGVSFGATEKKCGCKKKMSCCKSHTVEVRLKTNFQKSASYTHSVVEQPLFSIVLFNFPAPQPALFSAVYYNDDHAPPYQHDLPLLHCSLII